MPSRSSTSAPPAAKLTWPQVSAFRLKAQCLAERAPREEWLGVVPAMLFRVSPRLH